MTRSALFPLQAALDHGPWVAAITSLAVTPVGYAAIAAVLERRLLRVRTEFVALLFGDLLLALSIGLGTWLLGRRELPYVASLPFSLAISCFWLGFGLLQWRAEMRGGFYTRDQALAPTKIWHQVVIYPVLGYLSWTACVGGLLAWDSSSPAILQIAAKAAVVGLIAAWLLAIAYDRRHPKLGHPPYDWRKLRPRPRPWSPQSISLRVHVRRS